MHFKRKFSLVVLLFIVVGLFGCAGPKKELEDVVWPLPPDPPKIKFIMSFYSEKGLFGFSAKDIILGSNPISGFRKPYAVHVDKKGRIYVSDTGMGLVYRYDIPNREKTIFSGLGKPTGVVTDSFGRVFVADTALQRVIVFDEKGRRITAIGRSGELKKPSGVAINEELKRIYVVDVYKHRVAVFNFEDGTLLFTFGQRGEDEGEFNFPTNITVDKEGNVWVVDTMNGRVQIFDEDGNFIDEFGRLGDAPGAFARPKGIAIDSEDHIYVVDASMHVVQIFNEEGQVLLVFGGAGRGRGRISLPAGIAIDDKDRIYVVEQWNKRVSIYQFLSEKYKAEHPEEMKKLTEGLKRGIKRRNQAAKPGETEDEKSDKTEKKK